MDQLNELENWHSALDAQGGTHVLYFAEYGTLIFVLVLNMDVMVNGRLAIGRNQHWDWM